MAEPVRVLVADDHPLFRQGVARALRNEADFEVVGECADGDTALIAMQHCIPDVALVDFRMPGAPVRELVGAALPPTRVLVLSATAYAPDVTDVLHAGAAGYITKEASREAICSAVGRVAAGETVVGHEVQQVVVQELRELRGRDRLTERERQCLELLAEGLMVPAIAARLYLSPSSIKTHLRSLYEKLGVSDRAAAVAEGMRRGLLR